MTWVNRSGLKTVPLCPSPWGFQWILHPSPEDFVRCPHNMECSSSPPPPTIPSSDIILYLVVLVTFTLAPLLGLCTDYLNSAPTLPSLHLLGLFHHVNYFIYTYTFGMLHCQGRGWIFTPLLLPLEFSAELQSALQGGWGGGGSNVKGVKMLIRKFDWYR